MGEQFCKVCLRECNGGEEENLTNNKINEKIKNFPLNVSPKNKSQLEANHIASDLSEKIRINSGGYYDLDINDNFYKNIDDKDKLKKIIYNYKINLIISSFKKFVQCKKEAHKKIVYKKNMREKKYNIEIEGDEDINVNLFPEEIYDYLGSIFNKKKDGFGKQIYNTSNSIYLGFFLNDHRVGWCQFNNNAKGYIYNGETNFNLTGNYGIYYNKELKILYEGEWLNNRKNGYGIETYQDNSIYKGEFYKGQKKGIGFYKWNDNSSYKGYWENNCLEGFGIYKFKDGSSYSGMWHNNQMDGFGEFFFPGQKKYLGYFKKDSKSGFGIIIWFQKPKAFIGFWKDNKQNGLGKFLSNGEMRYGLWQDGKKTQKYDSEEDFESQFSEEENNLINLFRLDFDGLERYIKELEQL